jgi:hypothetical protein
MALIHKQNLIDHHILKVISINKKGKLHKKYRNHT